MQGNIKYVTSCSFKPSGQTAELIMMFEQEYRMTLLGQAIRSGKPTQTASYYHDIIIVF